MIEYSKPIQLHKKRKNGYVRFTDKNHPLADKCGIVYLHRHVASLKIGRWLSPDDDVHHIDEDTENNSPENLDVLTHEEHRNIHNRRNDRFQWKEVPCQQCGKTFLAKKAKNKYCSHDCAQKARRIFNIDAEQLERMVWETPAARLAQELGVSDVAIAKRCKLFGITKPPRGYWAKHAASSK